MDGRSHTVKGDGSEKECTQVRHLGTESPPWFRAGPHQAAAIKDGSLKGRGLVQLSTANYY